MDVTKGNIQRLGAGLGLEQAACARDKSVQSCAHGGAMSTPFPEVFCLRQESSRLIYANCD